MQECAVIVSGNIKDQEKVDAYKSVAGPIMKRYGAVMPPETYTVSEVVAGHSMPSFMLKIPFTDLSSAKAAFEDQEYKSVIEARDNGFGDLSIYMIEQ